MGVNRRAFLGISLALTWLTLPGCHAPAKVTEPDASAVKVKDRPRRAGKPAILVIMPTTADTVKVWTSLREEIAPDIDVVTLAVHPELKPADIGEYIRTSKPACIVLMDNKTLRLYRALLGVQALGIPVVVLMATVLEDQLADIPNSTGIAYEVPVISSVVALRSIINRPFNRIGIVHRPAFLPFVERQRRLAWLEKVEVVSGIVLDDVGPISIRKAIRELVVEKHVDALYMVNDNRLLTPELILNGWKHEIAKHAVPLIVGVPSLVSAQNQFGTFAQVPDHGALGLQAADLIYGLLDAGWKLESPEVVLPVSTKIRADYHQLTEQFPVKPGALDLVDEVVK